jgi:hypothetical protein
MRPDRREKIRSLPVAKFCGGLLVISTKRVCMCVCLWKIDSIAKKMLLKKDRKRSKKWKRKDMK